MRHPWQTWLAFALCAAVLVGTLAGLSSQALELDRADTRSRRQAVLEENSRLTLWRMDSAMAALVARENSHPYYTYAPFLPATQRSPKGKSAAVVGTPTFLLLQNNPHVSLHFQFDPDGRLTSPQVPQDAERQSAVERGIPTARLAQTERLFERLRTLIELDSLRQQLPTPEVLSVSEAPAVAEPALAQRREPPSQSAVSQSTLSQFDQQVEQQAVRNFSEFQVRSQLLSQNGMNAYAQQEKPAALVANAASGVMTPLWIGGELFLGRKVLVRDTVLLQGCWLDWPAIRRDLLASVQDLLPQADLIPMPKMAAEPDAQARMLAALPVRLEPGHLPLPTGGANLSPLGLSLAVAWCALLCMLLAAAVLLRGVMVLSERRAAFVSAVTHELRTPLTTFRLYSEMLAEDMVPREADRRSYLQTLRVEADRLMHLVENVLAYARLERGGAGHRLAAIDVDQLLRTTESRLHERALQAGMHLTLTAGAAGNMRVLTDPAAVEQILFNLVDNACKYAVGSERQVVLTAEPAGRNILLKVQDFGSGIPEPQRKRLFQPFRKSAAEAAGSAPGVGLGLALCRRWARAMGGDLRSAGSPQGGACFVLQLPLAPDA